MLRISSGANNYSCNYSYNILLELWTGLIKFSIFQAQIIFSFANGTVFCSITMTFLRQQKRKLTDP